MSVQTKTRELMRVAEEMYRQNPDWVSFFREMLGINGVMRTLFTDAESQAAFEQTPEYIKLQQMITSLRVREKALPPKEATKVITIRLPESLHDALTTEAHERQTSVNKLCISKLLRLVEEELVPNKKKKHKHTSTKEREKQAVDQ